MKSVKFSSFFTLYTDQNSTKAVKKLKKDYIVLSL